MTCDSTLMLTVLMVAQLPFHVLVVLKLPSCKKIKLN